MGYQDGAVKTNKIITHLVEQCSLEVYFGVAAFVESLLICVGDQTGSCTV